MRDEDPEKGKETKSRTENANTERLTLKTQKCNK